MPSIKRFIPKRIQWACLGYSLTDKLRILVIVFLDLVPKKSGVGFPYTWTRKMEEIKEKLWRGTIVKMDEIKFALSDFESFLISFPSYERFMQPWFKPKKGEVFVDIGAHIGKYTLPTAKVVENGGMVIAIEANTFNYQTLQRNIGLNKLENVVTFNLAAWNMDCELKLFSGDAAGQHSAKENRGLGWVKVKAKMIDHVLKELHLGRVDWIKIDSEGAECEVLYGLDETISKYKPKIVIEVLYENLDEMKRFMKEHEYGLIRISPFYRNHVYFICTRFKSLHVQRNHAAQPLTGKYRI